MPVSDAGISMAKGTYGNLKQMVVNADLVVVSRWVVHAEKSELNVMNPQGMTLSATLLNFVKIAFILNESLVCLETVHFLSFLYLFL